MYLSLRSFDSFFINQVDGFKYLESHANTPSGVICLTLFFFLLQNIKQENYPKCDFVPIEVKCIE